MASEYELGRLSPVLQPTQTTSSQLTNLLAPATNIADDVRSERTTSSTDDRKSSLSRQMQPFHIFCISIGAVIGMGFYVRTGLVEAIAGPGTVLCANLFLGGLAIAVMQDIARMLQIWPIGNPLMEFVAVFLDEDLAIIVSILYWLTYCCSFAGLTTVLGSLVEDLGLSRKESIGISVASLVVPIGFNCLPIQIFMQIEVFFGCVKIVLATGFIILMMAINPKIADENHRLGTREVAFQYQGPGGWFGGFSIALLYTSFAFVGIESVAATATEARTQAQSDSAKPSSPFYRPARLVPQVSLVLYLLGGWIVTQNVAYNDPRLPSIDRNTHPRGVDSSTSIFVNAANDFDETGRTAKILTGLLIVNVASTSSTALYIASRTLFGFANRFSGRVSLNKEEKKWYHSSCIILSWKNRYDVPWVAVIASAWLLFLPFLKYIDPEMFSVTLDLVVDMGSVSCILVWACESLAAGRLYRCLKHNPTFIEEGMKGHVHVDDALWYRWHLTVSFSSAVVCVGIVICGGILTFMRTHNIFQLIPIGAVFGLFIFGTLFIKAVKLIVSAKSPGRQRPTIGSDLKTETQLRAHFQLLRQLREASRYSAHA